MGDLEVVQKDIEELTGAPAPEVQLEAILPNISPDDPIWKRHAEIIRRKQYEKPIPLMKRPERGNTTGTPVTLRLNAFKIKEFPTKNIWQYDVSLVLAPDHDPI